MTLQHGDSGEINGVTISQGTVTSTSSINSNTINTITPSSKVASVTVSGVIPNDSTPNISSTQTGNNKTV